MDWRNSAFDWNQARAFLASAEAGSFSAAARSLRLTQSTLSRQVAGLEQSLGITLFERGARTLLLTEPGRQLLGQFQAMGDAALKISLGASGQAQSVSGRVSVAATDTVCAFWLPSALTEIRRQAPDLEIELVVTDRLVNLGKREADIAIRHTRPVEGHLVARRVRQSSVELYAARGLLERLGRMQGAEMLRAAPVIGFAPVDSFLAALNRRGVVVSRDQVRIVTDSGLVMCELIRQGFGIGVLTREVGDALADVVRLPADCSPIDFPFWLTTHRELHTSRRIRLVFDVLAETLAKSDLAES